jgi:hypothetical protein
MTTIKTPIEILSDITAYKDIDINFIISVEEGIEAIESYHNQFENKWVEITNKESVPDKEGLYFTMAKTNWHPFYRIDVFTGRLLNSFEDNGKSCFTHYQIITKPQPPSNH